MELELALQPSSTSTRFRFSLLAMSRRSSSLLLRSLQLSSLVNGGGDGASMVSKEAERGTGGLQWATTRERASKPEGSFQVLLRFRFHFKCDTTSVMVAGARSQSLHWESDSRDTHFKSTHVEDTATIRTQRIGTEQRLHSPNGERSSKSPFFRYILIWEVLCWGTNSISGERAFLILRRPSFERQMPRWTTKLF